ncbi:MAG: universal stress protein [Hyphomicrobiales bacterium]|nr:universal stress protein [Hyphomicrobiales bacterium]MCP5373776.1 universal stress protein [Hyphomicrobiales bacterium]
MFKTILVPIDLDQKTSWQKALPIAVDFARKEGATLHMMTVIPDMAMTLVAQYIPEGYPEKLTAESQVGLETLAREHVPQGVAAKVHVRHGSIYRGILDLAEDLGADLIVMGSHKPELMDYLIGPNAAYVVRHADCSVMVVRGE